MRWEEKNSKIVLYTVKKKCIHFKPDFTATEMIDLKTCSVMLPNLKKKKKVLKHDLDQPY